MPFSYYGAKHGLAAKYPPPINRTVVEPFAGSAAYSVHHAASLDSVTIIDADADLVALWREIQTMTVADVDRIGKQLEGERFRHPILAGMAGGSQMAATLAGKDRAVTPRMREKWPSVRARIIRSLPHVRYWRIIHGDYTAAPDIEATWFVDPPYQQILDYRTTDGAGGGYRNNAVDYGRLAEWCRSRRGLTIVCEQSPATWLPFSPLSHQSNGRGDDRVEVVWRNDAEQMSLFGGAA